MTRTCEPSTLTSCGRLWMLGQRRPKAASKSDSASARSTDARAAPRPGGGGRTSAFGVRDHWPSMYVARVRCIAKKVDAAFVCISKAPQEVYCVDAVRPSASKAGESHMTYLSGNGSAGTSGRGTAVREDCCTRCFACVS